MPYDRFLTEQIAGDLLPHDSTEQRDRQRIASGFLEVGPKVLLGNDPNQRRMDVADEQLDTIGKAVLGQTLGCARCHDHKFDPVPTADYYALAGILTSTSVMEQRYMLGEQRVMERSSVLVLTVTNRMTPMKNTGVNVRSCRSNKGVRSPRWSSLRRATLHRLKHYWQSIPMRLPKARRGICDCGRAANHGSKSLRSNTGCVDCQTS